MHGLSWVAISWKYPCTRHQQFLLALNPLISNINQMSKLSFCMPVLNRTTIKHWIVHIAFFFYSLKKVTRCSYDILYRILHLFYFYHFSSKWFLTWSLTSLLSPLLQLELSTGIQPSLKMHVMVNCIALHIIAPDNCNNKNPDLNATHIFEIPWTNRLFYNIMQETEET